MSVKGYFFEPTILINCTQKMDIIQEETFGPVLPVVEFTEVEDAIAWANDCEFSHHMDAELEPTAILKQLLLYL